MCNSDDNILRKMRGDCREEDISEGHILNYTEVRLGIGPWDSIQYEAWILQILLSEILNVPTTTESDDRDLNLNFYNEEDTYENSHHDGNDHYSPLVKATEVVDCRLVHNTYPYQPCAHIWTEVFYESPKLKKYVAEKKVDIPQGLGVVTQEGWYIPKFTAQRDPSLLQYTGYQGNRTKLAKTFKRPVTWKDYCDLYSEKRCSRDDPIAWRSPANEDENIRMFYESGGDVAYKGYFRYTDKNDCSKIANCTGHIANYPCWATTYVKEQSSYHGIHLESDGELEGSGYQSQQMKDIWNAANATKTDVVMLWWNTDPLFTEYMNTEAEFEKVYFPPPTQECIDARLEHQDDKCNEIKPQETGMCDQASTCLKKVISTGLHHDHAKQAALESPAYEALRLFTITELRMIEIFKSYNKFKSNKDTVDAAHREAACDWVVNHFDHIMRDVPDDYPRKIYTNAESHHLHPALFLGSLVIGCIAIAAVLIVTILVHLFRERRSIKTAQVDFLYIVLAGLLSISIGSIMEALPSSNAGCMAATWFVNFGYTLEFSPLIVKVATINKLMRASEKLKYIVIKRNVLYQIVGAISSGAVVLLAIWTILDPELLDSSYSMAGHYTEIDETASGMEIYDIDVENYCHSKHVYWNYIAVGWNALLLLCTLVLTFQMRGVRKDFNEALPLSFMIYSHSLFVVMRLIDLGIEAFVDDAILAHQFLSLLYSLDVLAALTIYFGPKFIGFDSGSKKIIFMPSTQHTSTGGVRSGVGSTSEQPALILSKPKTTLGYLATNTESEQEKI